MKVGGYNSIGVIGLKNVPNGDFFSGTLSLIEYITIFTVDRLME